MRGPAKLATYLGVGMTLTGFVLIFLAWNFAAELDYIQGQFPFMLSGGLGGLGLIIAGMSVMLVQTQREVTARRSQELRELSLEMQRLLTLAAGETAEADTDERHDTTTFAPAPRADAPAPSASESASAQQPTAVLIAEEGDDEATAWAPAEAEAVEGDTTDETAGLDPDEVERIQTALSEISGVGPAKQQRLAEHFGTYRKLRSANVDRLAEVPGVSRTLAERIHEGLRG